MKTRNLLLSALNDDAMAALAPHLFEAQLSLDRILGETGDAVGTVYFPSSGVVSMITVLENGRQVESLTVGREGAVGFVAALGTPAWTTRGLVQLAGMAWTISASNLLQVAAVQPSIFTLAMKYAQTTEAHLHQSAACIAAHALEARLCRWLLTCEDRVGDNVVLLTQDYLAMMLGVRRTSVTVAARAIQQAGLIDYRRGRITLLDRAGLERAACECYRATADAYTRIFAE